MPRIINKKDTQVISFDGVQDIWNSNIKPRPNKIKIDDLNFENIQKEHLFLLPQHIGKKYVGNFKMEINILKVLKNDKIEGKSMTNR